MEASGIPSVDTTNPAGANEQTNSVSQTRQVGRRREVDSSRSHASNNAPTARITTNEHAVANARGTMETLNAAKLDARSKYHAASVSAPPTRG